MIKNTLQISTIVFSIMSSLGCSDLRFSKEEKKKPLEPEVKVVFKAPEKEPVDPNGILTLGWGEAPNSYYIEVSPEYASEGEFRKYDLSTSEIKIASFREENLRDSDLVAGRSYRYDYYKRLEQEEPDFYVEVTVPVDVELNQPLVNRTRGHLLKIEGHRVIISSTVDLKGKNLVVNSKRLLSANGVINTFNPGSKAKKGQKGRSGGNIILQSSIAKGYLRVNLSGENGGDNLGVDHFEKEESKALQKNPTRCQASQLVISKLETFHRNGFPGGDTGNLKVLVESSDEFRVSSQFLVGRGSSMYSGLTGIEGTERDPGNWPSPYYLEIFDDNTNCTVQTSEGPKKWNPLLNYFKEMREKVLALTVGQPGIDGGYGSECINLDADVSESCK